MATINKIDLNGDTYDIESSALVTTQPTTPTEWAVYYDTVDDVVKVYDGTNWKSTVIDSLNSTSATSALSANQWRILDWKIADMMGLGKFLSLWNSTTGQPISFPLSTPYAYTTWDYFIIEVVSSATPPVNYKPTWSSYTGTASSTTETDEVEVWDVYVYDWQTWLLQSNHGKSVTFANIAWNPTDNTNLANALSGKQDTLVSWTNIKTVNSTSLLGSWNVAVQPTLVSWTNIKTVNNTSLLWSWDVAVQETLVSGTNIKTVNSTSILWSGNIAVQETISDLSTIRSGATAWATALQPNDNISELVNDVGYITSAEVPVTSVNNQTWDVILTIPSISTITVTLASANWSSKSITVTATWVTASNTVIVAPDPSSMADYTDWGVYCSSQASNSLTFVCDTEPSNDIDVNVVILG